jgi:ribonuclease BN (tRNA processing enzyme)
MYEFTIRGTRGTIPACGTQYRIYGGNTTCYSVRTDKGVIIFDAGTGIGHVAAELANSAHAPHITLLFTHFHMDHVVGLPCFEPIYRKKTKINIMADPRRRDKWKHTLKAFMAKPYWPIALVDTEATMSLRDIPVNRDAMDLYGVRISWFRVPHPQQCLAYRIEMPDTSIVIATDVEYDCANIQTSFINFCRGVDYLIYDTHYTPEEYLEHKGWGHSSWRTGTRVAGYAGAGHLVMTHHAPSRTDKELQLIIGEAQDEFRNTILARENLLLKKKSATVKR